MKGIDKKEVNEISERIGCGSQIERVDHKL
jgi:hypothetical protein